MENFNWSICGGGGGVSEDVNLIPVVLAGHGRESRGGQTEAGVEAGEAGTAEQREQLQQGIHSSTASTRHIQQ